MDDAFSKRRASWVGHAFCTLVSRFGRCGERGEAGRQSYDGLSSADIGRYNQAIMFGDHDEAFPDRDEWGWVTE